ncbi:hypothetical protein [Roseobacter sp.]|uniref:hypothetical protein n=1 Tax=Roseobacter sp. TaxID=1907202 RepID=UPI00385CDBCD
MKNLIWILVAVVIIGGGYFLIMGPGSVEVAEDAVEAEPVVAAEAEEEAPAQPETDVVEGGVEVMEEGNEAAAEAADSAGELTEQAADGVSDVAKQAQESLSDTVAEQESATEETVAETAEAVEATDEATALVDEAKAAEALTVEGFDFAKVTEMIDNSDLATTQKLALASAVEQAQDNPELLNAALTQLRDALGMQ